MWKGVSLVPGYGLIFYFLSLVNVPKCHLYAIPHLGQSAHCYTFVINLVPTRFFQAINLGYLELNVSVPDFLLLDRIKHNF